MCTWSGGAEEGFDITTGLLMLFQWYLMVKSGLDVLDSLPLYPLYESSLTMVHHSAPRGSQSSTNFEVADHSPNINPTEIPALDGLLVNLYILRGGS